MTKRSLTVVDSSPAGCRPSRAKAKPKDVASFAKLFKLLGDETRLEILGLLAATDGEVCVCDIESHIEHLAQPTISHHLKMLRDAAVVSSERRGTWVYYTLERDAFRQLEDFQRRLLGGEVTHAKARTKRGLHLVGRAVASVSTGVGAAVGETQTTRVLR